VAEEKWQKLINALAEYFDCDPDGISAVVLGVEHQDGDQLRFRTTSSGVPWHMPGFLDQLKHDIAAKKVSE
jgi:hypothetical protein